MAEEPNEHDEHAHHHLAEDTTTGIVEELGPEVARVAIGDDEAEWYFPLELLPDGIEVGTCLWFVDREDHWVPLGIAQERPVPTTRSIEDRLERHITDRRFDR
jgi:hypothetical protein